VDLTAGSTRGQVNSRRFRPSGGSPTCSLGRIRLDAGRWKVPPGAVQVVIDRIFPVKNRPLQLWGAFIGKISSASSSVRISTILHHNVHRPLLQKGTVRGGRISCTIPYRSGTTPVVGSRNWRWGKARGILICQKENRPWLLTGMICRYNLQ